LFTLFWYREIDVSPILSHTAIHLNCFFRY